MLPGEVLAEKFLEESEVKVTYQAGGNLEVLEKWLDEQRKSQMSSDDRPQKKKVHQTCWKSTKGTACEFELSDWL